MEFKDYYATLGVERTAAPAEIKRAYRKLARKYHPDVSKEPDAEARFKEVAEAHEALIDTERRAAYDDIAQRHANGQPFEPPPGWDTGFEYSGRGRGRGGADRGHADDAGSAADFSDFFESLFGRGGPDDRQPRRAGGGPLPGRDHHAKVAIDLLDAYLGSQRMVSLRMPVLDATGQTMLQTRQLEVHVPKGVRAGQHLRLAGQGAAGHGGAPAGDLYLEIELLPHPLFRVDGGDISFDLPVAPWEAALGALVTAPTPDGSVQLNIPPGSTQGRKLRLKGKGLPGKLPGDLYAVLTIALPPAASDPQKEAYGVFARAFAAYNPRAALEA
ncbi:MAG: DnaJ C-terminal domain-containing protein [Aquabacterium sp.]|nr:DnaJ C-terminal domain-containing protein [Aquabacterium sp.]